MKQLSNDNFDNDPLSVLLVREIGHSNDEMVQAYITYEDPLFEFYILIEVKYGKRMNRSLETKQSLAVDASNSEIFEYL